MSGGHWNYKDQTFSYDLEDDLPKIIKIVQKMRVCFHTVDWAESGDSSREDAEKRLYDLILALGDELFGEHPSDE